MSTTGNRNETNKSSEVDRVMSTDDSNELSVQGQVPVQAPLPVPQSQSTTVSTVAFEGYLLKTLLDLQTRSEVESCLNDIVTDVEFAVTLQDKVTSQTHQKQTERIIAQQELALEETHIVQKDRLNTQTLLADALVKDLWSLSKEVGSLLELKQKHEAMLFEYDELVAKLAQAEEDLYAAKRNSPPPSQSQQQQQQPAAQSQQTAAQSQSQTQANSQKPQAAAQSQSQEKQQQQSSVQSQTSATVVKLPDKPSSEQPAALKSDDFEETKGKDEAKTTTTSPTTTEKKEGKSSDDDAGDGAKEQEDDTSTTQKKKSVDAAAPVVALVTEDHESGDDEPPMTLETIDMEILMRIFGFLDAYDILNTAQVNISMYSRVDSLFGFGGGVGGGDGGGQQQDDNVSTTSTLATTPTVAAATQPQQQQYTPTPTATTASLSTSATPATKSAPPSTIKAGAAPSSAAAAAAATAEQTGPVFGHRILNILGGRTNAPTDASTSRQRQGSPKRRGGPGSGGSVGGAGRGRSGSDANDGKPPLSEAMAHSMAAKLNDAEINAIISMTEKLRSKEKQVALLIKEKEELEGKLSGSEAVKDFLISKVRDMEKIMNKSDETEKKVTQQIASDQEVIAFLDGRVQELERMTRVVQKEKNATQDKLKSVVAQNDKKVSVLSDMLQFERQKLKENEREWKTTKRLLVKEVKGCRAQIVALQAERDGFREQNDALRKAVMASGSGTPNGRSSSPHR